MVLRKSMASLEAMEIIAGCDLHHAPEGEGTASVHSVDFSGGGMHNDYIVWWRESDSLSCYFLFDVHVIVILYCRFLQIVKMLTEKF